MFVEGTLTNPADVTAGAASSEILAANAKRRYLRIQNTDATDVARIGFGITPTSTRGIRLIAGATLEFKESDGPIFLGAVNAIREAAADATLSVLEISEKTYS